MRKMWLEKLYVCRYEKYCVVEMIEKCVIKCL